MYSYVTFFFVYSGMYWYVILLVCTRMFLAYTHMLLVCPRLSSYVLACYLYVVLITIWVNSKFIVTQKRCFLLLNCHERRQLSFKSHTELQDFEDYACKQMTHFDVVIFFIQMTCSVSPVILKSHTSDSNRPDFEKTFQ